MSRTPRYEPEKVADALIAAGGVKSQAAAILGCDRTTVDNYIERHPELEDVWKQARSSLVDRAEGVISRAIDADDLKAAMYVTSTLGKDRGWTTRTEHTGKDGNAIEIEERNKQIADDTLNKLTEAVRAATSEQVSSEPDD